MKNFLELTFNIRALGMVGISLKNSKRPSTMKLLAYFSVLVLFSTMQMVLRVAVYTRLPLTLVSAIITFYLGNTGLQTLCRHAYFVYRKKEIEALVDMIERLPSSPSVKFNAAEQNMRVRSSRFLRRFSGVVFVYNGAFVLLAAVIPVSLRVLQTALCSWRKTSDPGVQCARPMFLYEFWWPSDIFEPPAYYFLVLWQMSTGFFFLTTMSATDAFACSLMLATSERASFLARVAPVALLPGPGNQMTPKFKAWVQYHQHYLRIVQKINKIMGPLIFTTHLFAAFNIITYLYFFIVAKEVTTAIIFISMMVGFLIQIFIYSKAGQQILNKGMELSRAMVGVSQVSRGGLGAGPARSALQVLTARCSGAQDEQINGLGFFTISMDTFTKVLSASISYLLVLLEVQE